VPAVPPYLYALALGSNRSVSARLTPRFILAEAIRRIGAQAGEVVAVSPILTTAPLGPSRRHYANGAMLLASDLAPRALLGALHRIEREMGRRRRLRWGARSLDIDIILWSGGTWRDGVLRIPHTAFHARDFVLAPLVAIAPGWRDPRSGFTVRQLRARLRRARPPTVDRPCHHH
jgi:2-amino-4-hydroxy-6-hydroxymethyldihydropteridine diphosphokinase